jgi:hypothetical protein
MIGAPINTTGSIVTQEISHDRSQFRKNWPVANKGMLAIAAAIRHVIPD